MKFIKTTLAVTALATILYSCEKDAITNPASSNDIQVSESKSSSYNNKSEGGEPIDLEAGEDSEEVTENLVSFITALAEEAIPESYDSEQALLFVEASLNHRHRTTITDNIVSEGFVIDLDISDFMDGVGSGNESTNLFHLISDEIYSGVDQISLPGTGSQFVVAVDLKFNPNNWNAPARARVLVGRNGLIQKCGYGGDYEKMSNNGGCGTVNPGTINTIDAIDQVDDLLQCHFNNECYPRINAPVGMWYNTNIRLTTNIKWLSTSTADCITEAQQLAEWVQYRDFLLNTYPKLNGSVSSNYIELKSAEAIDYLNPLSNGNYESGMRMRYIEAECMRPAAMVPTL